MDTYVKMNNGKYKKIKNINIGDKLYGDNIVYGKVIHNPDNIIPYKWDKNVLSGSQVIWEKDQWIRCNQSEKYKRVDEKPIQFVSLFTKNHTIVLYKCIIRDYIEVEEDDTVFDKIHNINLMSHL